MNIKREQLITERNYTKTKAKSWNLCAEHLAEAYAKQKEFATMIEHYKSRLMELSKGKEIVGDRHYWHRVTMKGSIDYSKIPELQDVDTEQYRRDDKEYWKLDTL